MRGAAGSGERRHGAEFCTRGELCEVEGGREGRPGRRRLRHWPGGRLPCGRGVLRGAAEGVGQALARHARGARSPRGQREGVGKCVTCDVGCEVKDAAMGVAWGRGAPPMADPTDV